MLESISLISQNRTDDIVYMWDISHLPSDEETSRIQIVASRRRHVRRHAVVHICLALLIVVDFRLPPTVVRLPTLRSPEDRWLRG